MKKEQKRKILFYGILAGALLLFAACAAHLTPYDCLLYTSDAADD